MRKKSLQRNPAVDVVIYLILGLVVLVVLAPYILMLLTALRSTKEIRQHPLEVLPRVWTLENYIRVLTQTPFWSWFRNSTVITVSVTLGQLFTSTIAGFVFAKYQFKFKDLTFWTILATMMVPGQVTMIPGFLVITKLGLYNKLSALIIPAMTTAFGIFLCRQFIEDVPDSLCEAAKIDGAGDFFIYSRIILPLIRPAIGSLAIFCFLATWNDYLGPLIMLGDLDRMTLPLALNYFNTQHSTDTGAQMAAAALVMLPVTVVFLLFQKQFIKGIAISGMK